jgi:hypothetical protein
MQAKLSGAALTVGVSKETKTRVAEIIKATISTTTNILVFDFILVLFSSNN